MTTTPPVLIPGSEPQIEILIKEARRRQRRRYLGIGVAFVVLAATGGIVASRMGSSASPSPGGRHHAATPRANRVPSPPRATAPRFFADTVTTGEGIGPVQVRSSVSGRLVAQVAANVPGAQVTALTSTGPGSYVEAQSVNGPCRTDLYRFRLTSGGRPSKPVPVGPRLTGWVSSLTAGAGGRVIGYAMRGCEKGSAGHIGVLDARTGRIREWGDVNVDGITYGTVALNSALTMSADGRLLAFTGSEVATNGRPTRQVVRVLPTNARAGTVAQRSRVVLSRTVAQPELAAVNLSPDARSFYLCSTSSTRNRTVWKTTAHDTATGGHQRVIATLDGTSNATTCQQALDSIGRFLLLTTSLSTPRYPAAPVLRVAKIDITTRTVAVLKIKLLPNAGMDQYDGMATAW